MVQADTGHASEWQRDHQPAAEGSHASHLRVHGSQFPGPSGFRERSLFDLPRDCCRSPILRLGDQDSCRRQQLCSAPTSGIMAEQEARSQCSKRCEDEDTKSRARTQCHQDGDQEGHQEIPFSGNQQPGQHDFVSLATSDSADRDSSRPEGRSPGAAPGSTTSCPQDRKQRCQHALREGQLDGACQDADDLSGSELQPVDIKSSEERRLLSDSAAQYLETQSWNLGPQIFQSLVENRRTFLLEVACSPESV